MVCGMELRHFLEKLEVSGSFFLYASDVTGSCLHETLTAAAIRGKAYIVCFVSFLYRYALRQKGNVR